MKKRLLLLSFILSVLTGCGNVAEPNKIELYSDSTPIMDGELELYFTHLFESEELYTYMSRYYISFSLVIANKGTKTTQFSITESKVMNDSTSKEISINGKLSGEVVTTIDLEPNIQKDITYFVKLPQSIKNENYSFYLNYNSTSLIYHLYESPYELRKTIDVTCVIDEDIVEVKKIAERRLLIDCPWTSTDYIYGVEEWYFDRDYNEKISDKYQVKKPITIYGRKKSILQYDAPVVSKYSYIYGYNFIPSNGELVIPREYENKPVYSINPSSFSSTCPELKTIYIPKTVRIYALDNFTQCKNLEYVYFEGTEEEWATMNEATFNSKTQIVFNTYK